MNYSEKFNTTKKAIAEIKRLENECARLAKMDSCDWSITLEQHIRDKDKEIENLQIKNDNQKKIIQGTHRYGWSTEQREEVTRLKSEIVQFRSTQDYQSEEIVRLQEEVDRLNGIRCDDNLTISTLKDKKYKAYQMVGQKNIKLDELLEVLKKRDRTINMLQVDMGFMSRAFMEQGVMFHTGRELTSGYDEKCDGEYKSTMTELKASN